MLAGPMAAHPLVRGLLAASVLTALVASPATAVEAVPEEEAFILPGDATFGAMVGDVDADGVRELVRLVPWEANAGLLAVEVISIRDGVPRSHGQDLVRREATADSTDLRRNPEDGLLPVGNREPTVLLAWRRDGQEEVLAASIGTGELTRACCLTLWRVRLDDGGSTRLAFVQGTSISGAWVLTADLDADATDELVVIETPNPTTLGLVRLAVLRWNGTGFERLFADALADGLVRPPANLGDSDGIGGEEVGFVTAEGRIGSTLHRISLDAAGGVLIEESALPIGVHTVLPLRRTGGNRLALAGGGLAVVDWPAGASDATVVVSSLRESSMLTTLGEGDDGRILVARGSAINVLDPTLATIQTVDSGAAASRFLGGPWWPFQGALAGGDPLDREALIHGGRLIAPATASGSSDPAPLSVLDIATLPGKTPIGLLGPGRAWAAVADGSALPTGRDGGALQVVAGERAGAVAIVPTAQLFAAEPDGGLIEPRLSGGLREEGSPRPLLLTSGDLRAEISAPPGTRIRLSGEGASEDEAFVGAAGGLISVPISAVGSRDDADEDRAFTARLLLATPGGHGYGAGWDVRVLRQSPSLSVEVPMAPLSFNVPLTGRTDPLAEVRLDGVPLPVDADGRFSADVRAGPLPTTVRVQATDRVGNTTDASVSVVAMLDYRRLPWIPIVAGLTLVAAAVLYLRAPRPAAGRPRAPDDGILEEIE